MSRAESNETELPVSYEAIRLWCLNFGPEYARALKRRQVALGQFHIGSVYPILYRLEKGGSIRAEAEEGARRRRSYRITAEGRRVLEKQRRTWRGLVSAIDRVSKAHHA